jgi:hypothetical protein
MYHNLTLGLASEENDTLWVFLKAGIVYLPSDFERP